MVLRVLLLGLVTRLGAGTIEAADLQGWEGAFIHHVAKPQNAASMKLGEKRHIPATPPKKASHPTRQTRFLPTARSDDCN